MTIKSLLLCALLGMAIPLSSHAAANVPAGELEETVAGLVSKSRSKIVSTIKRLGKLDDAAALPALEALYEKRLRAGAGGRVYLVRPDSGDIVDAITLQPAVKPGKLTTPRINNKVRRTLLPVIAQLKLRSPHVGERRQAAEELNKRPREDAVDAIRRALENETEDNIRDLLTRALAQIKVRSSDEQERLEALALMADSGDSNFRSVIEPLLEIRADGSHAEPNENIRAAAQRALGAIERKQFFISQAGNLFYGLSLGSILLLAALGLAITFGLMGVINMAHGEMLMLGAYSTFVVQNIFKSSLPAVYDWYLLAAIPTAFAVSAVVGIILERGIIRHLYGRPLETLLATWGISLLIIQTVRLIFGAQNVEVANPSWLSGGIEVMQGVVLPYNRIAIIVFVFFVVGLVWVLLQKTRLGLQVRAVTQNRRMAASMGIRTSRVDMWTFGLGCGVAGLGGMALSQIGNVGPELGQLYIVDCFMVVVLGGVGKLAGTVAGALGLGVINKFLEPISGAVLAKIIVLVFIILFIQKRPQGIFALKGRVAEA